MLIYATTTSERASKGQGGKYIEICIYNEKKEKTHYLTAGDNKITLYRNNPRTNFDGDILYTGEIESKGNNQKDEFIEPWDIDPADNQ